MLFVKLQNFQFFQHHFNISTAKVADSQLYLVMNHGATSSKQLVREPDSLRCDSVAMSYEVNESSQRVESIRFRVLGFKANDFGMCLDAQLGRIYEPDSFGIAWDRGSGCGKKEKEANPMK